MKDENSALHAKAEVAKPLAVVLLTLNWHATSAALEATYATLSWYALWGVAVISLLTFLWTLRPITREIKRKLMSEPAAIAAEQAQEQREQSIECSLRDCAGALQDIACSQAEIAHNSAELSRHCEQIAKAQPVVVVNQTQSNK